MKFSIVLSSLLASCIYAHPLASPQSHPGDSLVRQVYQFPNETWVENLAVRSNGKILVTLITSPEVWEINPHATPATAELIHRLPDATAVLGIAEYAPDVFGVNVGNFSLDTFLAEAGSWSVWSVDMSPCDGKKDKLHIIGDHKSKQGANVHKIADITPAKWLNGMTALPANPSMVLLADSVAGLIYRLDTRTGVYSVAIDDPALKANGSAGVALGVNGIQFAPEDEDHVYFTNTFQSPAFSRIPIDAPTGVQSGPNEVVVTSVTHLGGVPDDFCFDWSGKAAYIANGALNGLLRVDVASGKTDIVVGGTARSKVVGQTACRFGRTKEDVKKGTIYITNTGGIAAPPSRGIVGGGVFAFDTAKL